MRVCVCVRIKSAGGAKLTQARIGLAPRRVARRRPIGWLAAAEASQPVSIKSRLPTRRPPLARPSVGARAPVYRSVCPWAAPRPTHQHTETPAHYYTDGGRFRHSSPDDGLECVGAALSGASKSNCELLRRLRRTGASPFTLLLAPPSRSRAGGELAREAPGGLWQLSRARETLGGARDEQPELGAPDAAPCRSRSREEARAGE